jgi:NitT/TauT family transport system substrate-binding protein
MRKIGIALLLLMAVGCGKEEEPLKPVRIAAYKGERTALIFLAEQQGYFKKYGIQVSITEYSTGLEAIEALMQGKADVAASEEYPFMIKIFEKNRNLRSFGTISLNTGTNSMVVRKDSVPRLEALPGKKLGIVKGTASEFFARNFLIQNDIDLTRIRFEYHSSPEIIRRVVNRQLDGAVLWEPPYVVLLKRKLKGNHLSWSVQQDRNSYYLLNSTEGFISRNPETIRQLLKAMIRAEKFIVSQNARAKQFIVDNTGYTHKILDDVWLKIQLEVRFPQALIIQLKDQARFAMHQGLVKKNKIPNYLNFIYTDILRILKPRAVEVVE